MSIGFQQALRKKFLPVVSASFNMEYNKFLIWINGKPKCLSKMNGAAKPARRNVGKNERMGGKNILNVY